MSADNVIGVIGGTGLYEMDGLTDRRWQHIKSPFGQPSDELLFGAIGNQQIVFLPRHGRGHRIPPQEINFRANIDALKRAGATSILSVSAVGSLRADLPPGTFVIVDQMLDRTLRTPRTFFTEGIVAHVSMARPTCRRLGEHLARAAAEVGIPSVKGATYVAIEGPQFSSLAEAELHRMFRADVIGMTGMPEARLAREAELCYGTVAMVTDFDCWHPDHEHVTATDVVNVLHANSANARELLKCVLPRIGVDKRPCPYGCDHALEHAIMTAPEARDPSVCQRLDAVAGRVLGRDTAGR